MIHRAEAENVVFCSINCLRMCEVSMDAIAQKQQPCDKCGTLSLAQYHLTMSDSSLRNFCTYQCVMAFQSQFSRKPITLADETLNDTPVPTGLPKRNKPGQEASKKPAPPSAQTKTLPTRSRQAKQTTAAAKTPAKAANNLIISSVTSLASSTRGSRRGALTTLDNNLQPVVELEPLPALSGKSAPAPPPPRVETKTQVVVIPPLPKRVANATTMCRPATSSKEVTAKPKQTSVGCQTESFLEMRMVVPIPVPIYMPAPLPMYALPVPIPIPIPLQVCNTLRPFSEVHLFIKYVLF